MKSIEKWKGQRIKTHEIKFCVVFQYDSTVDNSLVRIVFGLAVWVMGRIFGTGEIKSDRYVTGIFFWQLIILGGLIAVGKGKGVGEF